MRILIVAAAVAVFPLAAAAAPLAGGETRVEVTADLGALGLTPGLIGTAAITSPDPLTLGFPVTGGDLDGSLAGTIQHEGSGVSLTDGVSLLELENFLIDTVAQTIFGDVSIDGALAAEDAPIFTFDIGSLPDIADLFDLDNPALGLFITATAAGVLTAVFGAPDLAGVQFGLAATAPEFAVPEPAVIGLFGLGLAGIAAIRRTRRRG